MHLKWAHREGLYLGAKYSIQISMYPLETSKISKTNMLISLLKTATPYRSHELPLLSNRGWTHMILKNQYYVYARRFSSVIEGICNWYFERGILKMVFSTHVHNTYTQYIYIYNWAFCAYTNVFMYKHPLCSRPGYGPAIKYFTGSSTFYVSV